MSFDAELVPYCGKEFRVRGRVETFVDERTGYLRHMKTPAVILDGVYCRGRYSSQRMLCPREIYYLLVAGNLVGAHRQLMPIANDLTGHSRLAGEMLRSGLISANTFLAAGNTHLNGLTMQCR